MTNKVTGLKPVSELVAAQLSLGWFTHKQQSGSLKEETGKKKKKKMKNSAILCSCQARFAAIVVEMKEVTGNTVPHSTLQITAQLNEPTVPSF